jgi:dolichol-phosphate mannosyltransferase
VARARDLTNARAGQRKLRFLVALVAVLQSICAFRVIVRLLRTARGVTIEDVESGFSESVVSIVVPVLDEEHRLSACLEALVEHGSEVREILVVDGGSHDRTRAIATEFAGVDGRVRLIDAPETPPAWNGKAWNLQVGSSASSADSKWLLFLDADVRAHRRLARSLVAHAEQTGIRAFSVAVRQRVSDSLEGMLHPSMLATLVYRFGIPGKATCDVRAVQANGQCFFIERALLADGEVIAAGKGSRCEDVTMARALARAGTSVGFYESADLVDVRMYASWRETVAGWPRSLPACDQYVSAWAGLTEVWFAQALPPVALVLATIFPAFASRAILVLERILVVIRISTLIGMRRAYERVPWTYWCSPLCDLPVAALVTRSALRKRHFWRGRRLVIDESPCSA